VKWAYYIGCILNGIFSTLFVYVSVYVFVHVVNAQREWKLYGISLEMKPYTSVQAHIKNYIPDINALYGRIIIHLLKYIYLILLKMYQTIINF